MPRNKHWYAAGQSASRTRQDLADRIADLATSEAANEALRRANAELAASRAALAAREAQLRLALDAARMANWEWQAEGDRLTGSPGREALYGRPPGTLGSTPAVLDAVHPEDRAEAAATIQRAMMRPPGEEEFDSTEFGVVDPDGGVRWLRSQGRVTERDPATGLALRAAGVTWDITDRRRAEEALRDAEARYRALFDAAPFGVIVIDPATRRIFDVNGHACAEYGYTREEMLRMTIAEVDALGDSEALRARGRARPAGPGAQEFEAQHRTKSGEVRDVLVRVQGIRLGDRDVTYGAHFDITARKAAEARLAQGAAILEATPDLVATADARTGRIAWLNAAFRAALGLGPGEDPSRIALLEDCHPPEVARMLAQTALPAAEQDGSWTGEGAVLARDGRGVVPVSHVVLAHRGRGGGVESWTAIMRDLSERKRAEEERLLLAREVDHRAKNTLAVVQAALRLTPKADAEAFARAVEGRRGGPRDGARARAHAAGRVALDRRGAPRRGAGRAGRLPARAAEGRGGRRPRRLAARRALRPGGHPGARRGAGLLHGPARAGDQRHEARRALRAGRPHRPDLGGGPAGGTAAAAVGGARGPDDRHPAGQARVRVPRAGGDDARPARRRRRAALGAGRARLRDLAAPGAGAAGGRRLGAAGRRWPGAEDVR